MTAGLHTLVALPGFAFAGASLAQTPAATPAPAPAATPAPAAGRVIDMSSASAAKIGIGRKQMMPVKLEVVAAAPANKAAK